MKKLEFFIVATILLLTFTACNNQNSNNNHNNVTLDNENESSYNNFELSYDYIKSNAVLSYPAQNDEWKYNVYTDNTGTYEKFVELTDCFIDSNTDHLSIPDTIDEYPVIALGNYLFANYYITSIVIPDSVIYIGEGCCKDCFKLSEITLSNSLTKVCKNAFNGTALNSLVLPESLKEVEFGAFYISYINSEDKYTIDELILPETLEKIGQSSFRAEKITVLNPNLEFANTYQNNYCFTTDVVYGYIDSTAALYCAEENETFVALE